MREGGLVRASLYVWKLTGNPVKVKETSINQTLFVPDICTGAEKHYPVRRYKTRYGREPRSAVGRRGLPSPHGNASHGSALTCLN